MILIFLRYFDIGEKRGKLYLQSALVSIILTEFVSRILLTIT